MKSYNYILFFLMLTGVYAQKPLPIIDTHLHAINVDANGPVPSGIGRGNPGFPDFNPELPWMATFFSWMAQPNGENPIMSPMTNVALREQTLEIVKRRNIYGVTSGNRVDEFMDHGGAHIIPSYMPPMDVDDWPSPEEIKKELET